MRVKRQAQRKFKNNPRFQALKILFQVEHQQQYSNVLLDRFHQESSLEERDKRLVVQMVYGTIQHRYTLDYYLQPVTQGKKMDPWIQTLLRLSAYQIVYLDRVPNRAAVHEAVKIAKINGHQGLGGFVNALLRNFLRRDLPDLQAIDDVVQRLSIQYSIQAWIVEELLTHHDLQRTEEILSSTLEMPFVTARINDDPQARPALIQELTEEGFQVEASLVSPYGIRALSGNLIHSKAFERGDLTIQDESSMLVAPLGKLSGKEQVLDACAAPGGKATHIAHLLDEGSLLALDISQGKLQRLKDHAQRLGVADKIHVHVTDATQFEPEPGVLYDRIYLDAPCSGLGLLRRNPEVKYEKTPEDVVHLTKIQEALINHVSQYLRPGGYLIYSTCTLTQKENEDLVDHFLESHDNFESDRITHQEGVPETLLTARGQVRVWPDQYQTDGFFIARLIKKQS